VTKINLDLDKARLAVADGVVIVCATCTHYWEAKDANNPQCKHAQACGGPFIGRFYPHYEGPFPASAHGSFCFICGNDQVRGRLVRRDRPMEQGVGVCCNCAPSIPAIAASKLQKQSERAIGNPSGPRNTEEYKARIQALRDQFNPYIGLLFRDMSGNLLELRELIPAKPKTLSALLSETPNGTGGAT